MLLLLKMVQTYLKIAESGVEQLDFVNINTENPDHFKVLEARETNLFWLKEKIQDFCNDVLVASRLCSGAYMIVKLVVLDI